jgi:acetyltransferase-like isoleucine patch superfamily enzyme
MRPIYIGFKFIEIGNNVFIRNNARIEGVSNYQGVTFNPLIIINDNVNIEQNLHLTCGNKIIIGKNTAIAANVTITDIHHPYTDIHQPPAKQQLEVKEVIIGSDCKIYNNAVILPGANIGKHTTIGANSVVKGIKYPDYCVIAGIPAVILKRYCDKSNMWKRTTPEGEFIN